MRAGLSEVIASPAGSDQQHGRITRGAHNRENGQAKEEETDGAIADATQNEMEHKKIKP